MKVISYFCDYKMETLCTASGYWCGRVCVV